jgi:hypothetical protein
MIRMESETNDYVLRSQAGGMPKMSTLNPLTTVTLTVARILCTSFARTILAPPEVGVANHPSIGPLKSEANGNGKNRVSDPAAPKDRNRHRQLGGYLGRKRG